MEKQLIKDLEKLLKEKDPEKISRLRESITQSLNADDKEIMQKMNTFTDTPDDYSRKGMENLIKKLKDEGGDKKQKP
jgi:hypothetical protein